MSGRAGIGTGRPEGWEWDAGKGRCIKSWIGAAVVDEGLQFGYRREAPIVVACKRQAVSKIQGSLPVFVNNRLLLPHKACSRISHGSVAVIDKASFYWHASHGTHSKRIRFSDMIEDTVVKINRPREGIVGMKGSLSSEMVLIPKTVVDVQYLDDKALGNQEVFIAGSVRLRSTMVVNS